MTLAHAAPGLAVCVLLAVASVLLLREGHRDHARPGHGRTRPHSRDVGTAQQDRDAIKEHDMRNDRITYFIQSRPAPGHPWRQASGVVASWEDKATALDRIASRREMQSSWEHRLMQRTTTVTETPATEEPTR